MKHPFSHRWSPPLLGATVAVVLVSAFLLTELAIGRLPRLPAGEGSDAWIAVVHALLLGAMVAAYASAGGLARKSLEGLARSFPDDRDDLLPYRPPKPPYLVISGLVGVISIGVFTPFLTATFPWVPSSWSPEVYWHRFLGPAIGWFAGLTLYAFTRESLLVSRATMKLTAIDVLEPERFAPVVRHGLANGLTTVVLSSIAGLFLFDPNQIRAIGPILAVMIPVMTVAIILPVWGARSRIRVEKDRERQWAREGIRSARRQAPVDTRRLGDLSAYYEIVDGAPEWPFTQWAFVRAALYFLIPAGAWLAAVILEAVLQAMVLGG